MSQTSFHLNAASPDEGALRQIATPDGVPVTVRIADLGARVTAGFVDFFLVSIAAGVLLFAFALLFGNVNFAGLVFFVQYQTSDFAIVLGIFLGFLLRLLYFPCLEFAWQGKTVGKRVLRLQVIDRTGRPLSFEAIWVRNITREIEFWIPMSMLAGSGLLIGDTATEIWKSIFLLSLCAVPFTNKERMRGGDFLAGTWVIKQPEARLQPHPTSLTRTADDFTRPELSQYGIKELEILADVLRHSGADAGTLQYQVAQRIRRRLNKPQARLAGTEDKVFLERFYTALKDHLENKKMKTGNAPKDKASARRDAK